MGCGEAWSGKSQEPSLRFQAPGAQITGKTATMSWDASRVKAQEGERSFSGGLTAGKRPQRQGAEDSRRTHGPRCMGSLWSQGASRSSGGMASPPHLVARWQVSGNATFPWRPRSRPSSSPKLCQIYLQGNPVTAPGRLPQNFPDRNSPLHLRMGKHR